MPLVNAKCTNCGGVLEVDSTKDALICPFCKQPYIVENAINNYNNTFMTHVEHADVINIYGDQSGDFEIKGGTLMKYNGSSTEVVIPDTVKKIDRKAFEGMAITRVVLPASMKEVSPEAFSNCEMLEEVILPEGLLNIGERAFLGCTTLEEVILPEGLSSIGEGAFSCCESLRQIKLPENIKSIARLAFFQCKSLKKITLPEKVNQIGWGAFRECTDLTDVRILCNSSFEKELFSHCTSLTSVSFSDCVEALGEYLFWDCTSLEKIFLPPNLQFIPAHTFEGCASLKSIIIPDGVKEIGTSAFRNCKSLTELQVPDSVASIGDGAFWGCSGLKYISIPHRTSAPNVLSGCDSLERVDASPAFKAQNYSGAPMLKRFDPNKTKSGGCYVATAVYGSYDCPEVWTLRRYRDYVLADTWHGRAFIRLYYKISPWVIKRVGKTKWFNKLFRNMLDKFVAKLKAQGYKDSPYSD